MEIEKGIPFPGDQRKPRGPWPDMEVGDSVWVKRDSDHSTATDIANAALAWGRKNGRRFASRSEEKDGVPGKRIWRIE